MHPAEVCAVLMTHRDVDDASVLPELLAQIPQGTKIEVVIGDGAYDTMAARVAIARRGALAGFCRIKRFLSKNGVDFIEQFLLGIA